MCKCKIKFTNNYQQIAHEFVCILLENEKKLEKEKEKKCSQ